MKAKLKCNESRLTHTVSLIEHDGSVLIICNDTVVAKLSALSDVNEENGVQKYIANRFHLNFVPLDTKGFNGPQGSVYCIDSLVSKI